MSRQFKEGLWYLIFGLALGLLVSITLANPSNADNDDIKKLYSRTHGDWTVECFTAPKSTKFSHCAANVIYSDKLEVFLFSDGTDIIQLIIVHPDWTPVQIKERKNYMASMQLGDESWTLEFEGIKIAGVMGFSHRSDNYKMLEHMAKAPSFVLKMGKIDLGMYTLDGSRAAIDDLEKRAKGFAGKRKFNFEPAGIF